MSWQTDTLLQLLMLEQQNAQSISTLANCCSLVNKKLDAIISRLEKIEKQETQLLSLVQQIQSELTPNPAVGFTATVTSL